MLPQPSLEVALDLDRYPVTDLEAPAARQLIRACKEELAVHGALELPGLVTPLGLATLVAESNALATQAFHNAIVGNAYLEAQDETLPQGHAKRLEEPTALGVVAYDEFPKEALLRRIFEWDPLMLFIGAVLGLERIYRYADPMSALNLSVMKNGDYLRWHFDQTDFVTSLAIQSAEEGGEFEYVPMIREAGRENFEAVRRVLLGSRDGVVTMPNEPGTLILFKGRHSLHRVTEIRGPSLRLIGLLAYDAVEGQTGTDHLRMIRYGRTEVRS